MYMKKTGLNSIEKAHWGHHFCHFYKNKRELMDVLIHYLKAGLENNEFCLLVTSSPLNAEDAKKEFGKKIKRFNDHINKGQLKIMEASQWYTQSGRFDPDRVIKLWLEQEKQAQSKGFQGLRAAGNVSWIEKKDWGRFMDYEQVINAVIKKKRMAALCSYPSNRLNASEIIDVVNRHPFQLIKKNGRWELDESHEQKLIKEEIYLSNLRLQLLQQITESVHKSLNIDKVFKEITERIVKTLGYNVSLIFELSEDKKVFEVKSYSLKKRILTKINKTLGLPLKKFSFPADPTLNSSVKAFMESNFLVTETLEEILVPALSKKNCSALQFLTDTKTYIVSPLKSGDEVIGGIFISSSEEKISKQELSLLKSLANAASTAVKNARLYTHSKQTQEKLREREKKYRELWDEAPVAYHVLNTDGIITDANQTEARMLGYEKKEMVGRSIFDFIIPEQRENARKRFKKKLKGKHIPRAKNRIYRKKDRSKIYVSIHDNLEFNEKGRVIGMRTAMVDITKRRQAEQQLEKQAAQSKLLYKIGQRVSSELTLDTLLSEIVHSVRASFDYHAVILFISEPDEKSLKLQSTAGVYSKAHPENLSIEWGKGMIGHAAAAGRTQMSRDVSKNPYYIKAINVKTKSELSVPIKKRGKVLGVLDIQSDEISAFSEADVVAVETLSSQIASAIENARLYEKAKKEIEDRKHSEQQVKASLKEKEILLQEIHHRVKNNMQIMLSLLRLQSAYVKDKRNFELFKESQNRIRSMALVHERLYISKNFASINFAHYIQKFTTHLYHTFMVDPQNVDLKTELEDVYIDINKAIPCGLIVNELTSNALKHAFPDGRKGELNINLHSDNNGKTNLKVKDNGVGLPKDVGLSSPQTLGMQLVNDLVKQINGTLDVDTKNGTAFEIRF